MTEKKLHPFIRSDFCSQKDFEIYTFTMAEIAAGRNLDFYLDKANKGLAMFADGSTTRINFSGNRTARQAEDGIPSGETGKLL